MALPSRDIATTCTAVSVTTASTVLLAANASRLELTLVNDGANTVYVQLQTVTGTAPTAVASQGIRLNASGGSYTTSSFRGALAAIAPAGTSVVTVTEI